MEMDRLIDQEIHEELKRSSNFTTRATLKLRVLFRFAELMNISRDSIYETKDTIQMDPSVSNCLAVLWSGGSLTTGDDAAAGRPTKDPSPVLVSRMRKEGDVSKDENLAFEMFLSKDFVKPSDVTKAACVLRKRMCLLRRNDPEDAPRQLLKIRRDLWCVFAADGLHLAPSRGGKDIGVDEDDDLNPYVENLSHPLTFGERNDFGRSPEDANNVFGGPGNHRKESPSETHARAVRTLYLEVKYATPRRIGSALKHWLKLDGDRTVLHGHQTESLDGKNVIPDEGSRDSSDSSDSCSCSNSSISCSCSSCSSSSSSSSSSSRSKRSGKNGNNSSFNRGDNSEEDEIGRGSDDYLMDCYKRYVSVRISLVANWLKQRECIRRFEEIRRKENIVQRKRKRAASEFGSRTGKKVSKINSALLGLGQDFGKDKKAKKPKFHKRQNSKKETTTAAVEASASGNYKNDLSGKIIFPERTSAVYEMADAPVSKKNSEIKIKLKKKISNVCNKNQKRKSEKTASAETAPKKKRVKIEKVSKPKRVKENHRSDEPVKSTNVDSLSTENNVQIPTYEKQYETIERQTTNDVSTSENIN